MLTVDEEHLDKITEAFYLILKGRTPKAIELPPDHPDDEVKQVVSYVNEFIGEHHRFTEAMHTLSRGDLDFETPKGGMQVFHSLKNLQANLRHLTWKTQQIADGDLSQHVDFMGDFSAAFNRMTQQLGESFEAIEKEKERSERLLLSIFPQIIAERLKRETGVIADGFLEATILMADISDFAKISEQRAAIEVVELLREVFTIFDRLADDFGVEKIKTFGDAYVASAGVPAPRPDHAAAVADLALAMQEEMIHFDADTEEPVRLRIGINTGPVIAGVIGTAKLAYDLWGETVNTAAEMLFMGLPGSIQVAAPTFECLKDTYVLEERGEFYVKEKGSVMTYLLTGKQTIE